MLLLHTLVFQVMHLFASDSLTHANRNPNLLGFEKEVLECPADYYSSFHSEECAREDALNWTFVKKTPYLTKKSSQEFNFNMKSGLKGLSVRAGLNF